MILALLLTACIRPGDAGTSSNDTADGVVVVDDGPTRGELNKRNMSLAWAWQDPWETGTCIEFYLHNGGPEMAAWDMVLETEPEMTNFQSAQWIHASKLRDGAFQLRSPEDQILPAENNSYFELCGEPRVRPTRIRALNLYEDPIIPVGVMRGTLYDQDRTLRVDYLQTGRLGGGDCLQLTIVNESWRPIGGWALSFAWASPPTVTGATGDLLPIERGPFNVDVVPRGTEPAKLSPNGGQVVGEICFDPLLEPTDMISDIDWDG